MARLLHHLSSRADGPFAAVHCGALPDSLLESELFGHEKGAFTGAVRLRRGKFELAGGGTLFLDEVGTISAAAQIKLLDVLQERRFQRVGGESDLEVDVRLVAATNTDLSSMMRSGSFRPDLFYRLSVFPIDIPPLRERAEEIPDLVGQLLERWNALYQKRVEGIAPDVLRAFKAYSWPGNVRELENVLERAHVLTSGTWIHGDVVPSEIAACGDGAPPEGPRPRGTLAEIRRSAVEAAERTYLEETLKAHHGRIGSTAREAGVTPRQIHKLLARHGIKKEWFKPGPSGECRREAETGLPRS
jgi:transcriptional regulator with GAF, ATPase, and Fis domain